MSAILSVLGSGAVRGWVAMVSASAADASPTSASFNAGLRREGVVGSASDMTALRPAQGRRSAIVSRHAFEGVNPSPLLPRRRSAELRAPLRRHGGAWHFLAPQIDLVDPARVADLLQGIGVEHDEVG